MAILIVDDESNTRTALRDLLTQMGHKTILEAKNGEEGLKIADAEKKRIEMIIADWEMPYMDGLTLAAKIAERQALDLAPFLLITSDLTKAKLVSYSKEYPRLDSYLVKPFRMSVLAKALQDAFAHRASTRDAILFFGKIGGNRLAAQLQSAIDRQKNKHWRILVETSSQEMLSGFVERNPRELGAILIDPKKKIDTEWMSRFKKSPLGGMVPVVCLSREPAELLPLRTFCGFFVNGDANDEDCTQLLDQMRTRVTTSWEMELLFQEQKTAMQQKKYSVAEKIVKQMVALDESNAEVHTALGDIEVALEDFKKATIHYRKSIEYNPCMPGPYIKLAELKKGLTEEDRLIVMEQAARYCPQNGDVLMSAAEAFRAAGNSNQARRFLDQILASNPNHKDAKSMLEQMIQSQNGKQ